MTPPAEWSPVNSNGARAEDRNFSEADRIRDDLRDRGRSGSGCCVVLSEVSRIAKLSFVSEIQDLQSQVSSTVFWLISAVSRVGFGASGLSRSV